MDAKVFCPGCGQEVSENESGIFYCYMCGRNITDSVRAFDTPQPPVQQQPLPTVPQPRAELLTDTDQWGIPHAIKRWNWGAFFLNWIWAFAHGMPGWALITLLGYAIWGLPGLVLSIFLGAKGNEYAWRARRFDSVEQFLQVQRAWGIAVVLSLAVVAIITFVTVMIVMFLADVNQTPRLAR